VYFSLYLTLLHSQLDITGIVKRWKILLQQSWKAIFEWSFRQSAY